MGTCPDCGRERGQHTGECPRARHSLTGVPPVPQPGPPSPPDDDGPDDAEGS